ncbi:MAG: transglycosylase SLT domain-containing protein [Bdellovibrionales bacterium]|nr:transglycosylase SLT domain-containing protein [Bdellovibrionales bacterium]
MSRIFTDSFERIAARIDQAHERRSSRASKEAQKDFSTVLADIEKGNNIKSVSEPAPAPLHTPELATDTLSNLTFREQVGLNSPALGDIQQPPSRLLTPMNSQEESVKKIETSVKETAPAPLPLAPQIISGQWTRGGAVGKISLNEKDIQEVIHTAGKYHGVDPHLSLAVARAESAFNPEAVSSDGHYSKGLFQLLDSTGREMLTRLNVGDDYNPFDASQNSFLGVGYLRQLHDLFSENSTLVAGLSTHPAKSSADLEKLAVAAFNTGQGNVARAQAKAAAAGKDPSLYESVERYLPKQTRDYVARVMDYRLAMSGTGHA